MKPSSMNYKCKGTHKKGSQIFLPHFGRCFTKILHSFTSILVLSILSLHTKMYLIHSWKVTLKKIQPYAKCLHKPYWPLNISKPLQAGLTAAGSLNLRNGSSVIALCFKIDSFDLLHLSSVVINQFWGESQSCNVMSFHYSFLAKILILYIV